MANQTLQLTDAVRDYILQYGMRELEILQKLRETTKNLPGAVMQISPEQGQLMALLVKLIDAKKTLDIGTFTGYSALVVALALPKAGRVITCDVSKEATEIAKNFWQAAQVTEKIELKLAPASETMDELIQAGEANTFDFIFIDADKMNYPIYYEKALILLRQGGLIIIDNVLWSGKVADLSDQEERTRFIRSLNQFIHQDKRVDLSLIPVGDGLSLIRKR